jgi:hypothetical protein
MATLEPPVSVPIVKAVQSRTIYELVDVVESNVGASIYSGTDSMVEPETLISE